MLSRTHCKVDAGDPIHDDKDVGISQLSETEVQTHWEHEDKKLKVEVEGGPGCWLML